MSSSINAKPLTVLLIAALGACLAACMTSSWVRPETVPKVISESRRPACSMASRTPRARPEQETH